ncbi:hypothetical protein F2P81_013279 [Scophthalmus maximus]|uniref:Uncharacterized protein n=1 Tax=Scophthalmus maximus TaxID=52904 RepID=A0A6A4SWY5_SCOMX|nr:hypothetical protein F2P81_013279 [Scophthalmus maximus]
MRRWRIHRFTDRIFVIFWSNYKDPNRLLTNQEIIMDQLKVIEMYIQKSRDPNVLDSIDAFILLLDAGFVLNWRGINGKTAFHSLQLKDVITGTIRNNKLTGTATNQEVETYIKKRLHLAGGRDGRRKHREERRRTAQETHLVNRSGPLKCHYSMRSVGRMWIWNVDQIRSRIFFYCGPDLGQF